MLIKELIENIKVDSNSAARAWIERVYARYPHTMQNNHVMVWGSGDDQQFAMFELVPSMSKRGAVEVKWFQAYPLRQGVGSRAMKELQDMAREDGIALTLFPWDKGQVSQAKLTKFYKGQGFKPTVKGGKSLAWETIDEARTNPDQNVKPASGMKELQAVAKTLGDIKNWAISMTAEPKLGINPQVGISEDTPKGIYFYPLNYALDKTRYGKLPWGDNYPYIQLFQYDRSGEMTKKTQVDPAQLKQALKQYCSDEIIQQAIDEPEYDGTPYWTIYDCLSRLGKSDETNVIRWNKVLRDLGFTSVYDNGAGWIAYNEPTQGVILDPRVIKQHKTISNRKETNVVTPDKIEQAIFDTLDMELAANRAWQKYDPDGTKLRAAAKEYAKDPKFKPYMGKPGTEEIYDKASSLGRWGARQLSDEAWAWFKAQQAQ
jgi:GNAT superfamily N-acetyltransferase